MKKVIGIIVLMVLAQLIWGQEVFVEMDTEVDAMLATTVFYTGVEFEGGFFQGYHKLLTENGMMMEQGLDAGITFYDLTVLASISHFNNLYGDRSTIDGAEFELGLEYVWTFFEDFHFTLGVNELWRFDENGDHTGYMLGKTEIDFRLSYVF